MHYLDYLVHTISFLAATISFSICVPSHSLTFYRVGYKPPTSTAPQLHQYICLQVSKSLFVMCRELMLLQTPFPKTFCRLPCGWESSILVLALEICPGSSSLVWRLSPGNQAHGTPGWLGWFLSFMCSPGVFLHAVGKSCLLWVKCKCSHLQMQMRKMGQTMNTDDCRKNLKEWQENSDKEGAADWVNQGRILEDNILKSWAWQQAQKKDKRKDS